MSIRLQKYIFTRDASKILGIKKEDVSKFLTSFKKFLLPKNNFHDFETIELRELIDGIRASFDPSIYDNSLINIYNSEIFGSLKFSPKNMDHLGEVIIEFEIDRLIIFNEKNFYYIGTDYDNHVFRNGYIHSSHPIKFNMDA